LLDALYIPTRYPDSLPDGAPTEHTELLASGYAMAAALQRDSRWLWHRS
jgi:hypothetical protein